MKPSTVTILYIIGSICIVGLVILSACNIINHPSYTVALQQWAGTPIIDMKIKDLIGVGAIVVLMNAWIRMIFG